MAVDLEGLPLTCPFYRLYRSKKNRYLGLVPLSWFQPAYGMGHGFGQVGTFFRVFLEKQIITSMLLLIPIFCDINP
jgi:hypothetical protein